MPYIQPEPREQVETAVNFCEFGVYGSEQKVAVNTGR